MGHGPRKKCRYAREHQARPKEGGEGEAGPSGARWGGVRRAWRAVARAEWGGLPRSQVRWRGAGWGGVGGPRLRKRGHWWVLAESHFGVRSARPPWRCVCVCAPRVSAQGSDLDKG